LKSSNKESCSLFNFLHIRILFEILKIREVHHLTESGDFLLKFFCLNQKFHYFSWARPESLIFPGRPTRSRAAHVRRSLSNFTPDPPPPPFLFSFNVLIPHTKLHLTQRRVSAARATAPAVAAVTARLCTRRHTHASSCRAAWAVDLWAANLARATLTGCWPSGAVGHGPVSSLVLWPGF
jgi:hypothetical protein